MLLPLIIAAGARFLVPELRSEPCSGGDLPAGNGVNRKALDQSDR